MSKSIKTRTIYRIIGSDYSAQEPRMSAFLSGEPVMYDAYNNNKDLYAMIAASAIETTYENCLEFWPEGTELDIDGTKVIAGSGKEFEVITNEQNSITVKNYEILETNGGELKAAKDILLSDKIISDIGNLTIINKIENNKNITFYFAN